MLEIFNQLFGVVPVQFMRWSQRQRLHLNGRTQPESAESTISRDMKTRIGQDVTYIIHCTEFVYTMYVTVLMVDYAGVIQMPFFSRCHPRTALKLKQQRPDKNKVRVNRNLRGQFV